MQNIDFESVWTEIKNKNSKNIVCGCLYRHPRYDLSEFLHYLEKCLKIIAKEKKIMKSKKSYFTNYFKDCSNKIK